MHITRRDFLKASGGSTLVALTSGVPAFLARAARAAASSPANRDSVLVVLQLPGGNDGLNTVVPYEDDAYHRSRPTLRLKPDRVLKLESDLGFHPDMGAFLRLYHDGCLSIVQGVGYPKSTRDHDAAKRDWHTCEIGKANPQTGWIGRAVDHACATSDADIPAVFIGETQLPFALHAAKAVVPAIRSAEAWLPPGRRLPDLGPPAKETAQVASRTSSVPEFLASTASQAQQSGKRLQALLSDQPTGNYPSFALAQDLRSVARLIRAELGIRIFFVEQGGGDIGGFDTHAGQAINHGALLRELAESVRSFVEDLGRDRLLDRVLVMTFSEFGRTLSENGRRGTDHGAAAPVFLAGGRLKARLIGTHPSLTELDNDAPTYHTDFRRVYATVLETWLGLDSQPILGAGFAPLDGVIA